MKSNLRYAMVAFACVLFCNARISAQSYPSNFSQVEVASGISNPTAMACAPDGRIFVAEQDGTLHVIKNGVKLPNPALQLSVDSRGERGLIGMVLHPQFSTNKVIYLYYTLADGSRNRVSRFWVKNDAIDVAREQIILELSPLSSATNHNGGAMQFHNDKLYIATGDNANGTNATNMETFHGKIIRINSNGSVPGDTPDYGGSYVKRRLWASGLRNPFTIAIQPGTGRLFVNDVGQSAWEEINDATAPALNFGWPDYEGPSGNGAVTRPVYAYPHGSGDGRGCAISGGTFFNPPITEYPTEFVGRYFYQDLCNNWINYLDLNAGTPVRQPFATGLPGGSLALSVAADGNLYFLSRSQGKLYRIEYNSTSSPVITDHPDGLTVNEHKPASFSVQATGALPLTFQWKKDGDDIPGATSRTLTIASVSPHDAGIYTVVVGNEYGSVLSNPASLAVIENNPPVVNIIGKEAPAFFQFGRSFYYRGIAVDPEDGHLEDRDSTNVWTVKLFADNQLVQQFQWWTSQLVIEPDDRGITNTSNMFYRLILTGTDSGGLSASDSVDVLPYKSTITLETNPPGLDILLDGARIQTPHAMERIAGQQFSLDVISPQISSGINYQFTSWNNGSIGTQALTIPISDTTVTANFVPAAEAWIAADVGQPNIAGFTNITDGTFSINSSGFDIWGTSDEFHYVYQPSNGNTDIRVRVDGFANTRHSWAKAGIMIRESLDPNATHATLTCTPSQGVNFFRRTTTGGLTINTGAEGSVPHWLRLTRNGNNIMAYRSGDGTTWELIGIQTIMMRENAYVGLVLSSRSTATLANATFTNVTIARGTSATSYGMEESSQELAVYPNPVKNDVFADVSRSLTPPYRIELLSAIGQIVAELEVISEAEHSHEFSMASMAKGMYIIQVRNGQKTIRRVIIKE